MISVVTITFNNYGELRKTLKSLEGVKDIESIVINGGDCEKTIDFLEKEYSGKYLSEKDEGISDAFNKGIQLASGVALNYLNSGDVLVNKNYYTECAKILENPSLSFVHSNIIYDDYFAGEVLMKPRNGDLGRGMPYFHQSLVVRKEVFNQIGPFKINYKVSMDYEFVCRMLKAGYKGFYYDKSPSINMDGKGISHTSEKISLIEAKRALIENNIYQGNRLGFFKRKILYYMRSLLLFFKLIPLIKTLKKLKYKSLG